VPGIVGIISQRPANECESLVKLMVDSMLHEPFYVSGRYSAPEIGVYSGWIAHPESVDAARVFTNEQRDLALVFAGECFFDSTPVASSRCHEDAPGNGRLILQLYAEYGEQAFEKLNGLFSGVLIDKAQNRGFLFNDRYGVERIYWHEDKQAFYFASEAKALLRILPRLRTFDCEGVAEFLRFGYTLHSRTLFEGVRTLPPASYCCFAPEGHTIKQYFSSETWESQPRESADSFTSEFEETFKQVLPRYFRSDAPLGISLTAGLDGRMIMACLPKMSEKPICYTFTGEAKDTLDARVAARVAAVCGLEYQTVRLGRDFFADFAAHADKTVYVSDGCLGVLGTHEIYLNKQARPLAPIRLTGVFGGEILRQVSFSHSLRLDPKLVSSDFAQFQAVGEEEAFSPDQHPVTSVVTREIPESRFGIVAAGRSQTVFRTPYLDNDLVALAYRIPPQLRSSAKPGFRVVQQNNRALGAIPTDMGHLGNSNPFSAIIRRAFAKLTFKLDYFYNEGLPDSLSRFDPLLRSLNSKAGILGQHKFLHYRSWFQRELADYVESIVTAAQSNRSIPWNRNYVSELSKAHRTGLRNQVLEINAVATLEAVERLLFRNLSWQSTSFN
jgi:asparagine synthase (glutamine-hydrolysing)